MIKIEVTAVTQVDTCVSLITSQPSIKFMTLDPSAARSAARSAVSMTSKDLEALTNGVLEMTCIILCHFELPSHQLETIQLFWSFVFPVGIFHLFGIK